MKHLKYLLDLWISKFAWSRKLFGREHEYWVTENVNKRPQRSSQTPEGKLFAIVGLKDTCPDCGGRGFVNGPRRDMSQNIYCMNFQCRSGFNITYFNDKAGICERIGKIEPERYPGFKKALESAQKK